MAFAGADGADPHRQTLTFRQGEFGGDDPRRYRDIRSGRCEEHWAFRLRPVRAEFLGSVVEYSCHHAGQICVRVSGASVSMPDRGRAPDEGSAMKRVAIGLGLLGLLFAMPLVVLLFVLPSPFDSTELRV